jgi:hypothetical protein
MTTSAGTSSGPTDPQRIAATSGSGTAAAIPAVMGETLGGVDAGRLERSCGRRRDSIRFGAGALGPERAEVYLSSQAHEPHRHDTCAIGVTTAGVQIFRTGRCAGSRSPGPRSSAACRSPGSPAQAGFADQRHLTRQFKRTHGLTPARWSALTAGASGGPSTYRIRGASRSRTSAQSSS